MEVKNTLVIPSEKNSYDKQGESQFKKLDTFNEILRKNYFKKYIEEKSYSSFKTITRTEFEKRKSFFEIFLSEPSDIYSKNYKKTSKINKFPEKKPSFRLTGKARSLDDLLGSGDECEAREREMTKKLEEIHEMVQKMQKMTGKQIREKLVRTTNKTSLRRNQSKIWGALNSTPSETSCKLKRKLIPIHFSSSFTTELGSTWKSFTEKIIFQNRFVPELSSQGFPTGVSHKKENVFRSTLEIVCLSETEIHSNQPFIFV